MGSTRTHGHKIGSDESSLLSPRRHRGTVTFFPHLRTAAPLTPVRVMHHFALP